MEDFPPILKKEKESYIFIVYITVNITVGELIVFFEILVKIKWKENYSLRQVISFFMILQFSVPHDMILSVSQYCKIVSDVLHFITY